MAAGFPEGQTPLETRLREVELAVADGATEIDIVISRTLVLEGRWEQLYEEVGHVIGTWEVLVNLSVSGKSL